MNPITYFILHWLLNAAALSVLPGILSGLYVENYPAALLTVLLLSLVNTFLRPLLILITLPITFFTLGFFALVINALLFWLASTLVPGIQITTFWTAFWAAILYSILSGLITIALGPSNRTRL